MDKNRILTEDADRVIQRVDLSELENKKILILGASGLIGSHMVYSIRRYAQTLGNAPELSIAVRGDLPQQLDFVKDCNWINVLQGELTDKNFLNSLSEYDIIIDAAGYGQPMRFMSEAVNTLKLNTYALFELMDKLKASGKFLFMSSSAVYTGVAGTPFREGEVGNAPPDHPRACYIEGKKCGEAICCAFRESGIDAKSVRLAVTYGGGIRSGDKRAMNTFIRSALTEKKICLLDDGKAEKAYIYVSDTVELIWKILLKGKKNVYNIGGKKKITMAELAGMIGGYCGVPVELGKPSDTMQGTLSAEILSMENTEKEFPKSDYIDISDGIKRTVDWAKESGVFL